MFMSEISKTFAPQNRAGFDITQNNNTSIMTDLISYIYALIDLENKLHNTKNNITSNDF